MNRHVAIQQRQLEEQIFFLQLTLASLQAGQDTRLAPADSPEPMPSDTVTSGPGEASLEVPLPIAAG